MIRKFALIKGEGTNREVKDLMQSPFVFTNPTGLGFTVSPETIDLNNGFFLKTNTSKIPLNTIAGDLTIRSTVAVDAAAAYNTFVRWLIAANDNNELFFQYSAVTGETYECKVALGYITKTEKDGTTLTCPIAFAQLTPWFKIATLSMTKSSTHSTYDFFRYDQTTANGGDFPAGVRIKTSTFTASNTLTIGALYNAGSGIDGAVVEADLTDYVGNTISVDYSSFPEDRHLWLIDSSNAVHDILDLVDITNPLWIEIPTDSACIITISFNDVVAGRDINGEFTSRAYYRTV